MAHDVYRTISHILCRPVKNLGPHPLFYTKSDGAVVFVHRSLAENAADFHNEQIDLRGVRFDSIGPSDAADADNMQLAALSDGKPVQEFGIMESDYILKLAAQGTHLYGILLNPRIDPLPHESAFASVWREMMPSPVIPYSLDARRETFAQTYRKLASFIKKWEMLRDLGASDILLRFPRRTGGPESRY